MADDPYRPRFFAYLSLFTFAMLMLVTADNLVQLFFGWEGVGLASYLLIGFWYHKPEANAAAIKAFIVNRVGDFGFALGIFAVFMMTGAIDFDTVFAQAPALDRQDHPLPRLGRRRAHADLPAAVHGRDGQVGAVPAAHLAARRDGRPDAGLRADPRRHHGDRRRVHGGAAVAAVRACAERADLRDLHRRDHRVLRRHHRPGAERHQAHRRLFDLLAARLHVRRHGRGRLFGRHVPPVHARLLQGAAVPRLRLGDHRDASRAGHPQDGRAQGQIPFTYCDDADRHAGADRLPAHRRLFLQGRHHRGGVRRQEPDGALRLHAPPWRPPADLVLFLAADLQDLPRRAARPPALRARARKPAGDAGAARLSWPSARSLAGLPFKEIFAGHGVEEFFRELAEVRPRQPHPRRHAPRAATAIAHAADRDDGDRLPGRLAVLHPPARHPGRARAPARRRSTASCSTSGTSTRSTT